MNPSRLAPVVFAATLLSTDLASADPVPVRFAEGVTRGFPVLRAASGEKLAQGELVQVAQGDRVDSRLRFHFHDGSYYDEQVVFSQRDVFTLLSYRIVQRGPSFPETIEASIDRETERYEVRYRGDEDSPEETLKGKFSLPPDAYNGMLTTMLKNLPKGQSQQVQIVAFTPKPRLVKMLLAPAGEDRMLLGDWPLQVTRFQLKPQLGLFASLLVTDLPDVKCWIVEGDAPGFVRFEGPLYFMGPVWRIEPN
jgi:hypothetical protein